MLFVLLNLIQNPNMREKKKTNTKAGKSISAAFEMGESSL